MRSKPTPKKTGKPMQKKPNLGKSKKEQACKHKYTRAWTAQTKVLCDDCGADVTPAQIVTPFFEEKEQACKACRVNGNLTCPNGYEGENMKCCRCERPQYPHTCQSTPQEKPATCSCQKTIFIGDNKGWSKINDKWVHQVVTIDKGEVAYYLDGMKYPQENQQPTCEHETIGDICLDCGKMGFTKIDFPKTIKNVRVSLEESQTEFGKRFNVSHAAVSDWESGKSEAPYEVITFVLEKGKEPATPPPSSSWEQGLADIIPAEVYSRNQYGGTTRRMKLSDEEIEDLFKFVRETLAKEKAKSYREGFHDYRQQYNISPAESYELIKKAKREVIAKVEFIFDDSLYEETLRSQWEELKKDLLSK